MESWIIWQLIDATLPTGAFAHSYGLEAAVQKGFITSGRDHELMAFLNSFLHQSINMVLPIVYTGHCYATTYANEEYVLLGKWKELDLFTNATLTNHVAHRASITQGSGLLRVTFQACRDRPVLQVLQRALEASDSRLHCHQAPIFGIICALLGISAYDCQRMFLYTTLRDVLSAATRLNLIGPIEATRILRVISTTAERLLKKKANRSIDQVHQSAPFLDLIQGMQDQLYTRIFNS